MVLIRTELFGFWTLDYWGFVGEKVRCCRLVRSVVRLEVHSELRVLKALIVMRVFLQMCKEFLEMKRVSMIGVDLFD